MTKAILGWISFSMVAWTAAVNPVDFETAAFSYSISESGGNLSFFDQANRMGYLRGEEETPCAFVIARAGRQPVTAVVFAHDRLTLRFGKTGQESHDGVQPCARVVTVSNGEAL